MENDRNLLKSIFSFPSRMAFRPHWYSHAAKRLVDVLAAALGLLFLSPVFALLSLLIKRDSPGPVFYRGARMGRGGRLFGMLKFRTMREEPASYAGPPVTGQDDPRVTPLGAWLRETKLNELPQLWNVLVGEMSLVGPRPEDPQVAATWPEDVRREILSVRPGVTSPASVAYHDEEKRLRAENVMDDYVEKILPDKLRLDQLYVRHHRFLTDLDALFWTFVILIPRLKERSIPEGWLFGGPWTRFLRRYLSWTAIDFVTAFCSIGLLGFVWRLSGPLDLGLWRSVGLAVVLAGTFGFFNSLLGLKTVVWSRAAAEDVVRLMTSCGLATLLVVALQLLWRPMAFFPVRFTLAAGLSVLFSFVAVRYRLRLVTGLASRWITLRRGGYGAGERALIVGAGEGGEFAAWLLKRPDFRHTYTATGLVDDDPAKQGLRFDGLEVLGTVADVPELVRRHKISVIFYAINKIETADDQRILSTCRRTGTRLVMLSEVIHALHHCLGQAGEGGAGGLDAPLAEASRLSAD